MKKINLLWTDNKAVHYLTDEPNPVHVEISGRGKDPPNFFKPARRFGAKFVPLGTPHGMSECLGLYLVKKTLG